MSIIYKQPVTEEQQKAVVQAQEQKIALDEIRASIKSEANTRSNDDIEINKNLNALRGVVTEEINARSSETAILTADLATEINQRETAVFNLRNDLNAEILARETAESNIEDDYNAKIDAEKTARAQALSDMQAAILAAMGNDKAAESIENEKLREQIEAEAANQQAGLTALTNRIETEEGTRAAEDTRLQNAIADETAARKNADLQLQNTFNAAISTETNARAACDTALTTALNNAVDTLADLIDDETIARAAADSDLTVAINNAKSTLEGKISAETAARQSADSNLTVALTNAINTEIQNRNRAIDSATQITKSYVDAQVAAVEGNLNIFTAPTTSAAGKQGLVPAPPAEPNGGIKILTDYGWRAPDDATLTISAVPTQTGSLTYSTNTTQAPTWANFDTKKLKIEGEISGVDAKTYTVTFTPLDIYMWSDTLDQQPKTATWKIEPRLLPKPAASVTEFTFNHNAQGLTVSNFDNVYESQTGTISATNANSYTATYKLRSPANTRWSDNSVNDINISWKINPLKLEKPSASVTEFTYNRATQGITVSNFIALDISETGVTSATDANSYSAVYKLKNTTNTRWADNSTADVTINWQIKPLLLTKPSASVTEFTYDRAAKNLSVSNFDSIYESQTGTVSAVAVNSYAATFKLRNTNNTKWADNSIADVTINWQIKPLQLPKPAAAVTEFDCDDTVKNLDVANLNSTYIRKKSGTTSESAPAEYSVVYELIDKSNTQWTDSTTNDVTINWKINLRVLTIEQSSGFAQVGTLTYTGNSQSVTVKNFDDKYHVLSGDISKVDAGTYTASVTPRAGCVWNDMTKTAKTFSWKIEPKSIAIPYADTTIFIYDGAAKTLQVKNYDAAVMTQSGTVSESAAGEYSATYALKSKTNYIWADSTTADKKIDWQVGTKELPKPSCATTQFTYSGDTKTITVLNVDLDYMTETGTKSEVDAGEYQIVYHLKNTLQAKWSDGSVDDVVIKWQIDRKKLTATQSNITKTGDFTYNKQIQYAKNLLANIDENFVDLTSDTAKIEAGDYTVKAAPKQNYCWNTGTFETKQINWRINVLKLEKPYAVVDTFDYEYGIYRSLTLENLAGFYIKVVGATGAFNAGNYSCICSLSSKTNTAWVDDSTDDVVINWTIKHIKIPAENSTFSFDGVFVYNAHGYGVKDYLTGYSTEYHNSLTGDTSATQAGTYTVGITPRANYMFADGSTDTKYVEWTIQPRYIDFPVADKTDFEFGGTYAPTVTGYDTTYMTRSGDYGNKSAIGNYAITFTLKNTTSTRWADGSVEPYVINWSIGVPKITEPYAEIEEFTYDGNEHAINIIGFDPDIMKYYDDYDFKITNAGSVTYFVEFKDKTKYIWEYYGDSEPIPITVRVKHKPLTAAQSTGFSQSGTLNYNGQNQTVSITNFDANLHQLSGQYISKNAGTYVAKITPRPNYCWNNGSRNAISVVWTINPLQLVKPTASVTDFEYDKQAHALSIQNFNADYMSQTGTATATAAGAYNVVFSLKDSANTAWVDSSTADVAISWSISKKQIPKPVWDPQNSSFRSNTAKNLPAWNNNPAQIAFMARVSSSNRFYVKIENYDAGKMSFSATAPASYTDDASTGDKMYFNGVGTYTITYHLTDDTVVWEGGDTNDFTLTLIITPKMLSAKYSNFYQKTALVYRATYTETIFSSVYSNSFIAGYYGSAQTWSGETSASAVGEYTAYVVPNENYLWNDGTRTQKSLKWRIDPAPIEKPTLDTSVVLTYDGNSKSPTLSGYDSTKMTLASDTSKTNAGIYTITATPTANYVWAEDGSRDAVEIEWQIDYLVLTRPSVGSSDWYYNDILFDGNANYTIYTYFSGTVQYPFGPNASAIPARLQNYDSDTMTIGGELSASDTGLHYITFTAKNANHSFNAKRKAAATLSWHIRPAKISAPTLKSNGILSYTGDAQSPFNSTVDTNLINVTGDATGTAKKSYSTTLALKYPAHSVWKLADNSTTTENQVYRWSIGVTSVGSTPSLAQDYFDYTGATKRPTINDFDADTMTKTGTESALKRGFYTITFKLKDTTGTCWSTGGSADIVAEWAIGTKRIAKPTLAGDTEFTYSGSAKNLSISGYDADTMSMSGYLSATDAGDYTVTFTPRTDTGVTYVWQDGTNSAVSFTWKINRQALPDVTFKQATQLIYNGGRQTVSITNFDAAKMDLSGDYQKEFVSTYTAKITPKANYCWADSTYAAKSVSWKISPKVLEIPVAEKTFYDYTGSEITLTLSNYTKPPTLVNGSTMTATAPGTYTATFSVNPAQCVWSDGTTSNKSITWTIGAAYYEVPTISPLTQKFALPTTTYSVSADFDENAISASGLSKTFVHTDFSTATNKATVTATFTLNNYPNAKWSDGQSGATRTVTWEVTAMKLIPHSDYARSSAYLGAKYDGNTHYWYELNHTSGDQFSKSYQREVNSASNPTYYKAITGDISKVDAGEYTVSLTPANWAYWHHDQSGAPREAKSRPWYIHKANFPISLSQDAVTLNDDNLSATVSLTTNSAGAVTVTSNDTQIATVSYNSATKTITINAGLSGTTSILVNQAADTNHAAAQTKTITVTVNRSLNSLTWAQISTLAKNGTLANYYKVGDWKTVAVSGTVGTVDINKTYRAVLIGINHNSGVEGNNRAHFTLKSSGAEVLVAFRDSQYNQTTDDESYFIGISKHNNSTPLTKYTSAVYNCFPADLQNVITACKKYRFCAPHPKGDVYSSLKVWALSANEVVGNSAPLTSNYTKQYEYFANGNVRTAGTGYYWLRDSTEEGRYVINDLTGNAILCAKNKSYCILPCFTIGGD